jgi:hypothetical protein
MTLIRWVQSFFILEEKVLTLFFSLTCLSEKNFISGNSNTDTYSITLSNEQRLVDKALFEACANATNEQSSFN